LAVHSPDGAINSAASGLESLYDRFEFARDDAAVSLVDLATMTVKDRFHTARVTGTEPATQELRIPYGDHVLHGETLAAQTARWIEAGINQLRPSVRQP
jgi:hypothetical protein